jgi:hypothetical protein
MKKTYSFRQGIENMVQQVIFDFNDPKIELEEQINFLYRSMEYLRQGLQEHVILFKENYIRLPSSFLLPCIAVDENDKVMGNIIIKEVMVSTVNSLTDEDARSCYFENKKDLIKTMSEKYQHQLQPHDFLSINKLGEFSEENKERGYRMIN